MSLKAGRYVLFLLYLKICGFYLERVSYYVERWYFKREYIYEVVIMYRELLTDYIRVKVIKISLMISIMILISLFIILNIENKITITIVASGIITFVIALNLYRIYNFNKSKSPYNFYQIMYYLKYDLYDANNKVKHYIDEYYNEMNEVQKLTHSLKNTKLETELPNIVISLVASGLITLVAYIAENINLEEISGAYLILFVVSFALTILAVKTINKYKNDNYTIFVLQYEEYVISCKLKKLGIIIEIPSDNNDTANQG